MRLLYPFAKRFIAGEDLSTALKSIHVLESSGYLSTVDILGEHIHRKEQAERAQKAYLDLVREINNGPSPIDLSVKGQSANF